MPNLLTNILKITLFISVGFSILLSSPNQIFANCVTPCTNCHPPTTCSDFTNTNISCSNNGIQYCCSESGFECHPDGKVVNYADLNTQLNNKLGDETLGGILSAFFPYLLTIAGLILFAMLIAGGFTMLTGAANKESQEKGKKILTSALAGFFILFLAYWIAQILQVIFKINIVS